MEKYIANRPIRNAYIAAVPTYHKCCNCKIPFTHGPDHPQAGKIALSKYPYCMRCLQKNAKDPGFVQWLRKLFNLPI